MLSYNSIIQLVKGQLTVQLTLCDLTGQNTHQEGLGLGGLVLEGAHPCFSYIVQIPLKCINIGSIDRLLVQLIPSFNYSIGVKYL